MNKDELSELLLSEDKELRELGISLLINNFNLPEKLYCVYDKYGKYYLSPYPQKCSFSFSLNKKDYLDWFERQFVSKRQKRYYYQQFLNIMKNINKDKLVEMIRSSDSEIKKLGISILLDNFDLPEKLYYIKDSDGYYTYSWEFSITNINTIDKEIYLHYLNIYHGRIIISILSEIFKYNENNRKE